MQIKTNNLSHIFNYKSFNEFKALKGINTEFKQGEFVTIIGPTGSGKTTFIEHLNALLVPTDGEIKIGKRTIKANQKKIKKVKEFRKHVGIVFQFAEYQLFEETVEKDIIFGPINMGIKKEKALKDAKKYLQLVGMPSSYLKSSPFQLSGGQKRRVALAGILAMNPDFLIFDEPTAGLDPEGEIELYKIFKKLNKQGKTIIIVTHNMDHVLEHSDRTLVFNSGNLVKDGKSVDIMYDHKFLKTQELEIPKIVRLVNKLKKKGLKIERPRNIKQLAKEIGSSLEGGK